MTESESVALPLGDAALQNSLYYSRFIRICQGFSAIFFCRNGRISPIVRGMAGKETTGRLPKARMGRKKRSVCQASGTGAGGQRGNQHAARLAWAARAVKCGWSARGRVPGPAGSEAIGTWHGWVELPGSQNMGGLSGAWRRGRQRGNRHAARLAWAARAVKCGWSAGGRTLNPVDGRRQAAGGGAGSEAIGTRRGWFGLS